MKKLKISNYIYEIILVVILFFALFVPKIFTKVMLALILLAYTIALYKLSKKRKVRSIQHKQVTLLMLLFGIIYLISFYLTGLYFGYYKSVYSFGLKTIFGYIVPIAIIIITTEIIRNILIAKEDKISKCLVFISMVLLDIILYSNIYAITDFNGFLSIVGFTLFPSIACNLLYNYISSKHRYVPVIVFRTITVLYAYIMPIIPDMYIFFRCFLRMLYPYIIYLIMEKTYAKKNVQQSYKNKAKRNIEIFLCITISVVFIMLISCKFKYGVLVIGSGSMTGTINKGDVVLYESYKNQEINEGDIIIFKREGMQVVHRIIDVRSVNGEYRYYTKGDYNPEADDGHVTEDQIIGLVKFKIKYIGYPTLWLRDIFSQIRKKDQL